MLFNKPNIKIIDDISCNFLNLNGMNLKHSSFKKNHVKVLNTTEVSQLREFINRTSGRDVEPFLRTNLCDVFIYDDVKKSVELYYCRQNEFDLIYHEDEHDFVWFNEVFLNEKDIMKYVFNKELFKIKIENNQVLYCPPFLEEIKENYQIIDIEMALHLYS